MVFSSPIFLFYFLPVILMICFLTRRYIVLQNTFLFLGSLLFYFWGEKEYAILVLISILINYTIGLLIEQSKSEFYRKWILALGLIIHILIFSLTTSYRILIYPYRWMIWIKFIYP